MSWLAWRQHRAEALIVAGVLAVVAGALVIEELLFSQSPGGAAWVTSSSPWIAMQLIGMILVPAVIGMFLGAPLVAREVERGTHRMAWSQSVTRRRWLLLHVGVTLGVALLASGALAALNDWALGPWFARQAQLINATRFAQGAFDAVGIVPVAYTVFAVAVGIAAGATTRRTVIAMLIVLAVFAMVRIPIASVARPNYEPPVRVVASQPQEMPTDTLSQIYRTGGWMVDMTSIDAQGRYTSCYTASDCQNVRTVLFYQPADRFWAFQLIESGIYLALAVLLLGLTWAAVRRMR